jgi:hypothetical protein
VNVHILNDLHIEFEDFTPPGTDADVVVLAPFSAFRLISLRVGAVA